MSTEIDKLTTDGNFLDRLAELERRLAELERVSVQANDLSEISDDLGEIRAGRFLSMYGDVLRLILSGEDLYDEFGVHGHFVGFDDAGNPQIWVNAEDGALDFAGGAGKLNRLGILMNGLKFVIQQTATNREGENQRTGWLEMFVPSGSDIPAWGLGYSKDTASLIPNGNFSTGDLTGWTASDEGVFSVCEEARITGPFGLKVSDVLSGTKTLTSTRFLIDEDKTYQIITYTNQHKYLAGSTEILVRDDAHILRAYPYWQYNFGGASRISAGANGTGGEWRALLHFDLDDYTADYRLTSAILKMYLSQELSGYETILYVYRLLQDWIAGTAKGIDDPIDGVTWTLRDGNSKVWDLAGADRPNIDRDSTEIGKRTFSASESVGWKEFNLNINKVQEIIDKTIENNGFMVAAGSYTVASQYLFRSKENEFGMDYFPRLALTWESPSNYDIIINYYDAVSGGLLIHSQLIASEVTYSGVRQASLDTRAPKNAKSAEIVISVTPGREFFLGSIDMCPKQSLYLTDDNLVIGIDTNIDGSTNITGCVKDSTMRFYNKSGGAVAEGDTVILDTGNDRAFKTTTTPGSFAALGVVKETIANNALGALATTAGEVAIVNCNTAAVAIGDYLKTSSTAKLATSNGKVRTANCFAKALSAKASGSTGTVYCMILDHNPVVATPAEISGLVLWMRPESLAGYAEGALVAQWNDESTSGNHAVVTTDGYKPKVRKSVVSGLDVVEFDGVDDRLVSPAPCFSGADPRTMIAVYKGLDGNDYVCGQSNTSTTNASYMLLSHNTNGDPSLVLRSNTITTSFIYGASFKIGCADYNGSVCKIYRNNQLGNSQSVTLVTASSAGFRLANYYPGGAAEYGDVQIAEIIVYNRCLTDTERNAVHEYLSNKYGITLS